MVLLIVVLSSASLVLCDRMSVPVPIVPLKDNVQLAVVAWNGTHEVLILSTIIRVEVSSKLGKLYLVELMPFRTVPEVEKSSMSVFWVLDRMFYRTRWGRAIPLGKGSLSKGEVEVIYEKRIGAHQIALVKFNSSSELVKFVEYYAKKYGVVPPSSSKLEAFREIFGEYLARGYRYASVDVVEVKYYRFMVEPIKYVFESDRAYYPLRVSNVYKGSAYVRIYLVTDRDVDLDSVLAMGFKKKGEVIVDTSVLGDSDIALMFKKAKVILLEYSGVSHFDRDFEVEVLSPYKRLLLLVAFVVPMVVMQSVLLVSRKEESAGKKSVAVLAGLVQFVPSVVVGVRYVLDVSLLESIVCGVGSGAGLLLLFSVVFKREFTLPCYVVVGNFLMLLSLLITGLVEANLVTVYLGVTSFLAALTGVSLIFSKNVSMK